MHRVFASEQRQDCHQARKYVDVSLEKGVEEAKAEVLEWEFAGFRGVKAARVRSFSVKSYDLYRSGILPKVPN